MPHCPDEFVKIQPAVPVNIELSKQLEPWGYSPKSLKRWEEIFLHDTLCSFIGELVKNLLDGWEVNGFEESGKALAGWIWKRQQSL